MMKSIRLIIGCWVLGMAAMAPATDSMAAGAATAQQAMQSYLASLSAGDVATLSNLVGGTLKDRSYRVLTQNTEYPQFLRSHYAGVVMTIETMTPAGPNYEAKVRFDYPSSDSATRTFTLSVLDGQWKVIDEQLF